MQTMRLLLAAVVALGIRRRVGADDYPNRPITVVVPFPAGGPTDAIIRNLGERMRVSLGQPLIVEYVTGAGGTVGTAPRRARGARRLHHHLRTLRHLRHQRRGLFAALSIW